MRELVSGGVEFTICIWQFAILAIRIANCKMQIANLKFQEYFASLLEWSLSPGNGHGRRLTVAVTARIGLAIFEVGDEAYQLLDGFLVGLLALLGARQFRFAQNAGFAVTAGPGDQRGGPMAE